MKVKYFISFIYGKDGISFGNCIFEANRKINNTEDVSNITKQIEEWHKLEKVTILSLNELKSEE